MKILQLFILVLAFLIIPQSQAGVLLEPVLGYSFTKIDPKEGSADNGRGPSIGGRLGYQNLGFQLGLDYLQSTINVDEKRYKEDLKTSEFGAFVGFEFPVLLRVYAGYIFSATGEAKYDGGLGKETLKFEDGTGTKFGVGFTGLPFVDINFEYRKGKFGEYKLGGVKTTEDTDFSSFMVGISLPFVI